MSNPITEPTKKDVIEVITDAAGAYSSVYFYKSMGVANKTIIFFTIADAAYIYLARAPLLDKVFGVQPKQTGSATQVNMDAVEVKVKLADAGAKLLATIALELGYEFSMGRDAFVKKAVSMAIANVGANVVTMTANKIDDMLGLGIRA